MSRLSCGTIACGLTPGFKLSMCLPDQHGIGPPSEEFIKTALARVVGSKVAHRTPPSTHRLGLPHPRRRGILRAGRAAAIIDIHGQARVFDSTAAIRASNAATLSTATGRGRFTNATTSGWLSGNSSMLG